MDVMTPREQFSIVATLINQRLVCLALHRDILLTKAPACLGQAASSSLKHEWLPSVQVNQIN
jgi:hypothetical protein